jgi:hypothetical protein
MLWKVLLSSFAGLIRSVRIIFHQFVGLFFLLLGMSAAVAAWREFRQYSSEVTSTVVRFYLTTGFAVLLLLFAGNAFWRARGIRKNDD